MKYFLGFVMSVLFAVSAEAAVTVIPAAGLSTTFSWSSGIGMADDSFSVAVAGPSSIAVTLTDGYVPGDEFALKLDGNLITWDSAGYVGGYFQGVANSVALSTGTHQFDIFLTALAPGYTAGGAYASFGAVTAVPEAETYAMLLAGFSLLGALSRRKKNQV